MTDRELDALVAEKVMGWERLPSGQVWNGPSDYVLKSYSTDIEAACQVVEKMRAPGPTSCHFEAFSEPEGMWCARFWRHRESRKYLGEASSRSMARAICLAATRALGVEADNA